MFDWLAVSPEADYAEEALVIERLFDAGLFRYHLRKPAWSESQCERLLEQLPQACRERVVVHQHYDLVAQYELGGYHVKDGPGAVEVRGQLSPHSTSRSLHRISDLDTDMLGWNYGFLSPVFPSLSKAGYESSWTSLEVKNALEQYVGGTLYALGGVTDATCQKCVALGFSGAVLHGFLWMHGHPIEQFNKIRRIQ